ncbi:MAG TPA: hypothetical protein VFC31_12795 [Candidatus Limnocylindria bacterium]|nr:hypothetical protein [Candidatus Limnocylindria bacterium]
MSEPLSTRAALAVSFGLAALVAQGSLAAAASGAAPQADVEIPWYLFLTPEVITALLIAFGIIIVVAAIVAFVLYRSLRRSGRWDRAILLLRSRYDEGPRAELSDLRLRLMDALAGARRAVELSAAASRSGELATLQRRLQRLAVPLDGQLQLLQGEPDEVALRRTLAPARSRVREFERVARSLRETASVQLEAEMTGELPALGAAAERELAALQAGVEALEELTATGDLRPTSGRAERRPIE